MFQARAFARISRESRRIRRAVLEGGKKNPKLLHPSEFLRAGLFAEFFPADGVAKSRYAARESQSASSPADDGQRPENAEGAVALCSSAKEGNAEESHRTVASDDDTRSSGIDGCPMTRRPTFSAKRRDADRRYDLFAIEHADGDVFRRGSAFS